MTKDEIISLVDTNIVDAYEHLDTIFLEPLNPNYRDLAKEYYARPNNFEIDTHRSKLKVFIRHNFPDNVATSSINNDDHFFCNLCKLDFKHQTQYFNSIIKSRNPFCTFVIRGKQAGVGQSWLVAKLIQHYQENGNQIHKVEHIELKGNTLGDIINEFSRVLGISYANITDPLKKKTKLSQKFEARLATKSQIFVLENAYGFIHSEEFDIFMEIIKYIYERLNESELNTKCIFFFLEQDIHEPYKCEEHYIDSHIHKVHEVRKKREFCFIDLYIKEDICNDILEEWLDDCPEEISDFFLDDRDNDCLAQFIGDGNPQTIIYSICKKLGKDYVQYERKWRQQ